MRRVVIVAALVVGAIACTEGPPSKARVRYNEGVAALEGDKPADAVTAFLEARSEAGFDGELRFKAAYNLGAAYAKQGETAAAEGESRDVDAAIDHYRQASAWFADARRLRPGDAEAQANLERVQARILALVDEANRGEHGLERRLEQLIDGERELRDAARGLWTAQEARTAPDPLADKDTFDREATRQRILGAEAGVVADLAGDEITAIGGKAEAQRSDEEKGRLVQLQNLDLYLQDARKEMLDARRNLAELRAELAYRRTEGALIALKRAREQLLDPVTVLRGVAQEHVQLMQYAAQVDAARSEVKIGEKRQEAPEIPAWMEPVALGGQQLELHARVEEVRARLAAGAAAPDAADPQAGQAPDPQAEARARMKAQIAAALPSVEQAGTAMRRASENLRGGDVKGGIAAQREALEAMARAIEQFLELRGLIDLALSEQGQVVAALAPESQIAAAQRQQVVGDGAARNRERIVRMQQMIADELAKQKDPQQGQELYGRAETLRAEALAATDALVAVAQGGKGPPALESARTAQQKLEEMQRLFFSVIEHLKQLIREQGETSDQTAEAIALVDDERKPRLPGLVQREGEHQQMADAIAQALAAQADAAAQQATQKPAALREASTEVRNAVTSMQDAADTLTKASDPNATMSFDLSPAHEAQKQAIEHLESALRLLQPPPPPKQDEQKPDQQKQPKPDDQKQEQEKQDQQQQQQQQQQSKEDAERRLQQVREREAQRQRERRERQHLAPEPVDKDW